MNVDEQQKNPKRYSQATRCRMNYILTNAMKIDYANVLRSSQPNM